MQEHVRVWLEAELRLDPCSLNHPSKAGGGKRRPRSGERRLGLLLALEPP
jgi:hypothetical protein